MRLPALASRTAEGLRRHRLGIPEAADRVGVDPVTLWKMTKGRGVSAETLVKFAGAFGEDAAEWVALVHPELASAIERIRSGVVVAPAPPQGITEAPPAGVVKRSGHVEWVSEEVSSNWGGAMGEFVVETATLGPLILSGDRLLVTPAETAEPGDLVIVGSRPAPSEDEGTAEPEGTVEREPPGPDLVVRFVAAATDGIRVCAANDEPLAEPYNLPRYRVLGVVEQLVRDVRRKKRPRKRK